MQIEISKTLKLWLKKLQLSWRFKFAHHPLCDRYKGHVFQIGRKKPFFLCQGCSLTAFGIITGTILFLFIFQLKSNLIYWLILINAALFSTLIIESLSIKSRGIKKFSRFILGIGLGISFMIIINGSMPLIIKFGISANVIIGYSIFRFFRRDKEKKDLCKSCPELEKHEICSGLKLESKAMKEYSDYATKILYSKIERLVNKKYNPLDNGRINNSGKRE